MPAMPRRKVAEATISKEKVFGMSSKKHKAAMAEYARLQNNYKHKSALSPSSPLLDLQVIDEAFGKHSDLYEDVLQVASSANQEEIQLAYFDRRSELFTLLAKIDAKPHSESMVNHRYKAERKMDSVVLAVRILGDPHLRVAYNQIRPGRLQMLHAQAPQTSSSSMAHKRKSFRQPRAVTPTADDGHSDIYDTSAMGESAGQFSVEMTVADAPLPVVTPPREKTSRKEQRKHRESPKRSFTRNHRGVTSPKSSSGSSSKSKNKHYAKEPEPILLNPSKDIIDVTDTVMDEDDNIVIPVKATDAADTSSPNRNKKVTLVEDNLSTALESRQEDDTLAETLDTISTTEKVEKSPGVFSCITGSRFFQKISDEISGACEDTLVSVDQVFNAFTLTDKDIKAVTKKIHKAKRQLDN